MVVCGDSHSVRKMCSNGCARCVETGAQDVLTQVRELWADMCARGGEICAGDVLTRVLEMC